MSDEASHTLNPSIAETHEQAVDQTQDSEQQEVDHERRRFLSAGTSVVGGIGLATAAWPFVASMNPSARAIAIGAPVKINISKLGEGEMLREEWRGKPIWIVRRTKKMLATLDTDRSHLRDPDSKVVSQQPEYAHNEHRSIKPEYLVLVGICTHLGCSPVYRPDVAPEDLGSSWPGGFFCPCHGSRFDLAGRVYKNVPAIKNLEVPPYRFASADTIVVGESKGDVEET